MSEMRDLYQEVILDHAKKPRNFRCVDPATHSAKGHNPLCGDRLTLTVRVADGKIAEIGFQGDGCAISKASASLMTEAVEGHTPAEAEVLYRAFHRMLTTDEAVELPEEADKLEVFSGVREFPVRVKCATLAWHTLKAALEGAAEPVKTE